MSGEEVVPVPAAETTAAAISAPGEPKDLITTLQVVLRKSLAQNGLIRGLRESSKVIEKCTAQLILLADDCNQADYIKLVKALCNEHNVNLINVPSAKTLGEWCGLASKLEALRNEYMRFAPMKLQVMSNLLYYYGMCGVVKELLLKRYSKDLRDCAQVPESDIVQACMRVYSFSCHWKMY